MDGIYQDYTSAKKRLLLFDYDGTLVKFSSAPHLAKPGKHLLSLLTKLAGDQKNTVVIISGRDPHTLEDWLGHLPIFFIAEHGAFIKHPGKAWQKSAPLKDNWKPAVQEKMQIASKAVAGSFIEEKTSALVWHYRQSEGMAAAAQAGLLIEHLRPLADKYKLAVVPGQKIVEVHPANVDKGTAAYSFLKNKKYDFVLAAGDDTTDEDLFAALPPNAYAIKVGTGASSAEFRLASPAVFNKTLEKLSLL